MERFFKNVESSNSSLPEDQLLSRKKSRIAVDFENLPGDPGERPPIWSYDANDIERVRRKYLLKGPCQPHLMNFPQRDFGDKLRRFSYSWFTWYPKWLEYSEVNDSVYCLYCYLFRPKNNRGGGDYFTTGSGFKDWKHAKERLVQHVGNSNSAHNQASMKCQDLMNQKMTASVSTLFAGKLSKDKVEYKIRLNAAIDCIRLLLRQGLAFRGHDESDLSNNRGNYLELFHWLADHVEVIRSVSFENAPQNCQLTSSNIQKDIAIAAACETTSIIVGDMGDAYFSILVDESRDISTKEQMALVVRYVNKYGNIIESFIGILHVANTTSPTLKEGIDGLFARHGLSLSRLRGQGYDGASNMQGVNKGLKTAILEENRHAFFVHCFAHQLQLVLVGLAKKCFEVESFFQITSRIMNVVGASCKRQDILKAKQHDNVVEALKKGEVVSGTGLNQETTLKRAGDTRWGSHYGTVVRLATMFSSVIEVLELIMDEGVSMEQRVEASGLLEAMQSYDFIFTMHLMKTVLAVTNDLSLALQKRDQEIENAMRLVSISKQRLQSVRDNGWTPLLNEVSSFCCKLEVVVPNMEDNFVARGRSRRGPIHSNYYHFHSNLFCLVIDRQRGELDSRFSEANTELLRCVGALNPTDSFSSFNKETIIRFARFYDKDFSNYDLVLLDNQLEIYIIDVRTDSEFSTVQGISGLCSKLVETKKHSMYPLVYKLITLALTLPVSSASAERAFSAMKIVKNRLRNRLGDELHNACLVTYIEKDAFSRVTNEAIIRHFQTMAPRREQI